MTPQAARDPELPFTSDSELLPFPRSSVPCTYESIMIPHRTELILTLWTTSERLRNMMDKLPLRHFPKIYLPDDWIVPVESDDSVSEVESGDTIGIRLNISKIPNMSDGIVWSTVVVSIKIEVFSSRIATTSHISILTGQGMSRHNLSERAGTTYWTCIPLSAFGANPWMQPVMQTGESRVGCVKVTVPLTPKVLVSRTTTA